MIADLWQTTTDFWTTYSQPVVTGTGAALVLLLAFLLWRFLRTRDRSKIVSTLAAVVVMAWTSEGLLAVAVRNFHLPVGFAAMTFFVFEAMMLAAALKAEEHRAAKGSPGPAGGYVFVLAAASGTVASFGAHNAGEVVLRVILPPLAVGLWWIFLVSERDGDLPEWKARRAADRARRAAEREATWTITPRTVLVRLGLMKPGQHTVTQAQREHLIGRMTAFGCTLHDWPRLLPPYWWAWWRLRRMARRADRAMIREVRRRVRRATRAVELVVPSKRKLAALVPAGTSSPVGAELPQSDRPELPAEGSAPDGPEVPHTPPAGTSGGTQRKNATGSSGGRSGRKQMRKVRRTAEESRRLIAELRAQDPEITQTALAAALGVTTRRLRDIEGTDTPAKVNGHHPAGVS